MKLGPLLHKQILLSSVARDQLNLMSKELKQILLVVVLIYLEIFGKLEKIIYKQKTDGFN